MSAQKGDFISFSFNSVHSSELGIIRTSDGSRFNENLLPTIQDKTVQVPGGDGTYFFGSYYTQRQFNVPIAFDNLKEDQVRRLYQVFGDKQIHELIFDERPYKVYMAKINGTPNIKTICFDGPEGRVYKGEGSLNFICYYPFAKSRFKYLDEYTADSVLEWDEEFNNKDEWSVASRMKNNAEDEGYDILISGVFGVFNAGDIEADFKIYYPVNTTGRMISLNNMDAALQFSTLTKQGDDEYVCFNSKTNLLEGYKNINLYSPTLDKERQEGKTYYEQVEPGVFEELTTDFLTNMVYYEVRQVLKQTGTLYNKHIVSGDFFKLPLGNSVISAAGATKIEYDHPYF